MLQDVKDLTSPGAVKGLNTQYNILGLQKDQSPNMMNVKVNYDGSLEKRQGSHVQNQVSITGGSGSADGFVPNSGGNLVDHLKSYWNLNEASGTRYDIAGAKNLSEINPVGYSGGIRNQAANFVMAETGLLSYSGAFYGASSGFTSSQWFYVSATDNTYGWCDRAKMGWHLALLNSTDLAGNSGQLATFNVRVNSNGSLTTSALMTVTAFSMGLIDTSTWYNAICWWSSGATAHIGININGNVDTMSVVDLVNVSNTGRFYLGGNLTNSTVRNSFSGRIDEVGYWDRVLTANEQLDLYAAGRANPYQKGYDNSTWAAFDFGASSIRWLTCAAGTGVYASSNLGVSWVTIATDRTSSYQYFDRSKNVMIMTSEAYDEPLYWAGSVGTYAAIIGSSSPHCKYSINFQGWLILLNSQEKKRSFNYIDENFQLSSTAWLNFDLPSSADDEITNCFILRRYLYVSTKYKIYRVSFVGGNPDWQYVEVKGWGFIPRTVKRIVIMNNAQNSNTAYSIGEVVIGLTYDRKLRIFDGSGDQILSNNVEKDNGICDFALDKISYLGSGPLICFSEVDPIPNVYSLCVGIGQDSMQTSHFLNYDGRCQALFPYSNMPFNCMCVAESANRQFLMAFDRSGWCHMMNSGNLDAGVTPINDVFESPLMFDKTPSQSSKGHKTDLFFSNTTSGNVFYQDRFDFETVWHDKDTIVLDGSDTRLVNYKSIDIPDTYNTYQFRIGTSSGTNNPWRLQRYDHFTKGLGIGRNY